MEHRKRAKESKTEYGLEKKRIIPRSRQAITSHTEKENLLSRITINPEQCGGHPCIRGMRIRVADVLELLAAGLTYKQVLKDLPDLEMADVRAALQYAATRIEKDIATNENQQLLARINAAYSNKPNATERKQAQTARLLHRRLVKDEW